MSFVSFSFLILLFVTVVVYYLISPQYRWIWLLVISFFFYMCSSPVYVVFLFASILVTYFSGVLIGKVNHGSGRKTRKKAIVALSLVINIGVLITFKYLKFFSDLLSFAGINAIAGEYRFILPIGISFYTFQSLSYTLDVYRGDVEPEYHLGKYALFVSFFPTLISGPIQKSKDFLKKIDEVHSFDYDGVRRGILLMLWGYFEKMVVADRLGVLVNTVFNSPAQYHGLDSILAVLFYTFQIYCDFAGYSNISLGVAETLGFHLSANFKQPYFSKSIQEFWRRWHISLGTWFRDYLYFPLGGSRCPKFRHYLNLLIVFTVCGLWHGASLTFLFWGILHGFYQIVGLLLKPVKRKVQDRLGFQNSSRGYPMLQTAATFLLVSFAWVFFRADTMENAFLMIGNMFQFDRSTLWDGSIFNLGLTQPEFIAAILGIFIVVLVDILTTHLDLRNVLTGSNTIVRWTVYLAAVLILIIFGTYGSEYSAQSFIYFQF